MEFEERQDQFAPASLQMKNATRIAPFQKFSRRALFCKCLPFDVTFFHKMKSYENIF